jgi:uncharacterized protein
MHEPKKLEESNRENAPANPVMIRTFILKVASRCNLNCNYCYVYNKGDDTYLSQPQRMSDRVAAAAIDRVRDYCLTNRLDQVEFIFHGGEPLLAGREFFERFVARANEQLLPKITPSFNMQTNGTLLDRRWLDLMLRLNIGFGISLDGPKEINDANRVDYFGRGSYDRVRAAIDLILSTPRMEERFGGILTVINLQADPLALHRFFRGLGVSSVDFILPDGQHDNPPADLSLDGSDTPFADWLIPIFDAWFNEGDPSFQIRLFQNILDLVFGGKQTLDSIGGGQNGILVIETDGGIEPVDVLKICGNGFTKLGYNVISNDIQDVYQSSLIAKYQSGLNSLCGKCNSCPIRDVCGGGYLPHRYSSLNGFDNPSVYCRDLKKLIVHIRNAMLTSLPDGLRRKLGLMPIFLDGQPVVS